MRLSIGNTNAKAQKHPLHNKNNGELNIYKYCIKYWPCDRIQHVSWHLAMKYKIWPTLTTIFELANASPSDHQNRRCRNQAIHIFSISLLENASKIQTLVIKVNVTVKSQSESFRLFIKENTEKLA